MLSEAIRIEPDSADAHNNPGNLLAGRRDFGGAEQEFAKALENDASEIEACRSYSLILATEQKRGLQSMCCGNASKRSHDQRRLWSTLRIFLQHPAILLKQNASIGKRSVSIHRCPKRIWGPEYC